MSTKAMILIEYVVFVIIMLDFAIYEMRNAYKVDPNDETFLD